MEARSRFPGVEFKPLDAEPGSAERGWRRILRGRQKALESTELRRNRASHTIQHDLRRIFQPVKRAYTQNFLVDDRQQALPQCQQIAGKIPAVDC